jgi:hypothetical protein
MEGGTWRSRRACGNEGAEFCAPCGVLPDGRLVRELGAGSTELRGIPHIERTRRRDVRRGMRTTKKKARTASSPVPSLRSALLRSALLRMIAFRGIPCCAPHRQSHSEYAEHASTPSVTKACRDRRPHPSVMRRPSPAPASVVCPPRSPQPAARAFRAASRTVPKHPNQSEREHEEHGEEGGAAHMPGPAFPHPTFPHATVPVVRPRAITFLRSTSRGRAPPPLLQTPRSMPTLTWPCRRK